MKYKILIIGLGYVGLPLALNLSKYHKVIGYDKSAKRIKNLQLGIDNNNEFTKKELQKHQVKFLSEESDIKEDVDVFIVTVPTPVSKQKKPDIRNLISACKFIAKKIKRKNLIVIESTIAPGTTENICLNLISKHSKIEKKYLNICFSPERINPGDKKNNLKNLHKIISGNSKYSINFAKKIYKNITKKVVEAESIKSAELAKIVENAQRDLNISFMNELYQISDLYKLNYRHVLSLCKTKWNFVNFQPGLVGGHCVPVDPYYLIEDLKKKNFKSKVLTTSRNVNEKFVDYISKKIFNLIKKFKNKKIYFNGISFKDNVSDKRNSKYFQIYKKILKVYKNDVKLGDVILHDDKINIEKFNIFIIGSKNKDTKKIISHLNKKAISQKLIINIFGFQNKVPNKYIKVINI